MICWLFQAVSIATASRGNINRFISFGMIACSSMAWESRKETHPFFRALLGMENCLDLAIRTEGIAGSVIPTIELAASPVSSGERSGGKEKKIYR